MKKNIANINTNPKNIANIKTNPTNIANIKTNPKNIVNNNLVLTFFIKIYEFIYNKPVT